MVIKWLVIAALVPLAVFAGNLNCDSPVGRQLASVVALNLMARR